MPVPKSNLCKCAALLEPNNLSPVAPQPANAGPTFNAPHGAGKNAGFAARKLRGADIGAEEQRGKSQLLDIIGR